MILTSKMFEDAMKQINVAFAEVNKRVDKLEKKVNIQVDSKEKPSASKKRPKVS
jgi:tetrahydromethanopterin S-methyltransferase subunit G